VAHSGPGSARSSATERHRTRLDTPIEGESIEPAASDPWAAVALELSGEEVRKALAELPIEQRQTIELAYYGGYSQSEIATVMEVPLGTVKGRVRIALDKLRASLADRMETPWHTQ
jgi:RNA polymerase sigma-70 factor (ECF subfamily)